MKPNLCITIRFIQPLPLFHGRRDAEQPEWPPSPMRAFQALLNAAGLRSGARPIEPEVRQSLQTLERLRPVVIAPRAVTSNVGYRAYVPHNQADLVTAAWHRGNMKSSIAEHRVEKDFRPIRIDLIDDELPAVHYLYPLEATSVDPEMMIRDLRPLVRSITHLGWGIDQVAADATLIDDSSFQVRGERWQPSANAGRRLRVHRAGSLDALTKRYGQFLNRIKNGSTPVSPLTESAVDIVRYRRDTDAPPRPHVVFKLFDGNDDMVSYPHRQLIHVAGMVRNRAIELMTKSLPRDPRGIDPANWVRSYVAGHQSNEDKEAGKPHSQFSYIPLPSTGHAHTDPAIRRVMIVAPVGDEAWLTHLTQRLDGEELKPENGTNLPPGTRLELIPDGQKDGVRDAYTGEYESWASFTPVILPGHDDHKPDKTHKLILKALVQSGFEQPCEFEWSPFSLFPKSYSSHKYDRDKRPIGYIRPDHLLHQTAVHLRLHFEHPVAGPITVGAGRHCGFGLFAGVNMQGE
jgi:CRISPR-associated protein Csb2